MYKLTMLVLTLSICLLTQAKDYYVSSSGNDANAGTQASPLGSLQRAHLLAASGDRVILRGGTYTRFSFSSSDANYNIVNTITKSGITYIAFSGETPIFNFSSVSTSKRVCAFLVTGSNNTFQGFEVTGVPVGTQKQSECFRINSGSGNRFLLLRIHDCPAIGIYINKTASTTLVENCDAFNLVGIGESIGNTDGFGSHSSGRGNTFRSCRAWNCSDDGYDCIKAAGAVTFDRCWAYKNGASGGDGNGFKIGGWADSQPPNPLPVHTVRLCLSANNRSHGFYANHQPGQAANWYNNTAYNNASGNYNMLERVSTSNATDVAGTREVMHNNLAYVGTAVKNLNESGSIVSSNSWTLGVTINNNDFISVDATQMTRERQANGNLPNIAFMHLAAGSDLINAGQNVGLSFSGSAPDLGCFETSTTSRVSMEKGGQQAGGAQPEAINVLSTTSENYFSINAPGQFNYSILNSAGLLIESGSSRTPLHVGNNLASGWYLITIQTNLSRRSVKVLKK